MLLLNFNKAEIIKFIFVFAILATSLPHTHGDVVLLHFQSNVEPSKELSICAMKKPFTNNDTYTKYQLVQINPANPCAQFTDANINGAAEYIQLDNSLGCPFVTFANVLQANKPKLVLIGSDGPFVCFLYIKLRFI